MFRLRIVFASVALVCCVPGTASASGMERVHLSNGFAVDCQHREQAAEGRVRLYLDSGTTNYLEVDAAKIVGSEMVAIPALPSGEAAIATSAPPPPHVMAVAATGSLHAMIANAGAAHNVNTALLESVVQAESGGHARAVSHSGARGLMQLMPATAHSLGVADIFEPEQNLGGGTTYLDRLLTRYHNNIAFALAAYNAGPAAVDRYRGVPPYRETQAYVAKIIREFNRRTLLARRTGAGEQMAP